MSPASYTLYIYTNPAQHPDTELPFLDGVFILTSPHTPPLTLTIYFLTSSSLLQWKLVQIYELVASFDLALVCVCVCFSHSVQSNTGVPKQ